LSLGVVEEEVEGHKAFDSRHILNKRFNNK
jgi:hypothetical protein